MKVIIDCSECGKAWKEDVSSIIKKLIECAENNTIYGGFMCRDCVEANIFDDDED